MSARTAALHLLRPLLLTAAIVLSVPHALAAAPAKAGPGWSELTTEQQQILAPLQKDWDQLDAVGKKKWIGVAGRYPKMTPTGQKRVQRRMQDWAKLTPAQRRQARESYRSISKIPPERKQDLQLQWEQYQSLSPAERRKLDANAAEPKPAPSKRKAKPPAQNPTPSPQTNPAPR